MRRASVLLALVACACGGEPAAEPTFPLRDVAAPEIAELESSLPAASALPEPDEELRERVRGLVLDRAHAPERMRAIELADLQSIGAPAVPIVDALIDEKDRSPEELLSALQVLGAIDDPGASDALVERVDIEKVREPWIRAQAAFQLAHHSSDHVVPILLARLKYETDGETVIWMAAKLARHSNFAGLDGVRVLAASASAPDVQANAQAMLAQITENAGFSDPELLYSTWYGADEGQTLPREEPSPRLRLEMWKRIAALAEFDLRIVDDARFALVGSSPWIVDLLREALHEKSAYVRLHVVQCLERMGARATDACDELARMLDEPRTAPAAAGALGAIGCAGAMDALLERTRSQHDAELRNAAAASLGRLGQDTAIPVLRELLDPTEALDLRQAAAQSLLALGDEAPALPVLIDCLTAPASDCGAAESALETWLTNSAAAGDPSAAASLVRWKEIAGESTGTPDSAELARRRAERSEFLRAIAR